MNKNTVAVPVSLLACAVAGWGIFSRQVSVRAAAPMAGPVYAQLSSEVSQDPNDTKPHIVEMQSNDALAGLDHSDKANTGTITVKEAGAYFMVAAVQVGKDVDNSGCRQVIPAPNFTTVMVCQGVAECKAGDTFQVAISASSPGKGLGIKVIKPTGEPVIPSIIFSMYKIN